MFKRAMILSLVVLLLIVPTVPGLAKTTFKYGHANAVTYPYHLAGVAFGEALEKKTGGELVVQIHPMGQLGGEKDITEGLQLGTVDFQASSLGVTGNFIPAVNVFNLPFLFKSPEHFLKVMNGPLGAKVLEIVQAQGEKVGLKVLGIAGPSFRLPMNNVRAIKTVADFKGLRIRTMQVPIHMAAYKALGAVPLPIAFGELYTALQTGVVDGNENGPATLAAMKFYEVQKHVTTLPIVSNGGVFLMSMKTWNKLSASQKKAVTDSAQEWVKAMNDECLKQDKEALELMKAKGVTITEVPNVRPFISAMKPVYDEYLKDFSPELQKVVNQILDLD